MLKLTHWEQLTRTEAGQVLGCSANAVSIVCTRRDSDFVRSWTGVLRCPTCGLTAPGARGRKDPPMDSDSPMELDDLIRAADPMLHLSPPDASRRKRGGPIPR